MKLQKEDLLLYAVTDRSWLRGRTLYEQVEEALRGGITCLQLREKNLPKEQFYEEAVSIKQLCARYQIPFLINDDVQLAREIDADGVHIGQKDMDVGTARALLGPEKIIGVSAKTPQQALAAQEGGADYLGVGAAFPTGTKQDAQTVSHEQIRAVCGAAAIPAAAIGGITYENLSGLSGTGISGIAVVSAIFAQPDIEKAAAALKEKARAVLGF